MDSKTPLNLPIPEGSAPTSSKIYGDKEHPFKVKDCKTYADGKLKNSVRILE